MKPAYVFCAVLFLSMITTALGETLVQSPRIFLPIFLLLANLKTTQDFKTGRRIHNTKTKLIRGQAIQNQQPTVENLINATQHFYIQPGNQDASIGIYFYDKNSENPQKTLIYTYKRFVLADAKKDTLYQRQNALGTKYNQLITKIEPAIPKLNTDTLAQACPKNLHMSDLIRGYIGMVTHTYLFLSEQDFVGNCGVSSTILAQQLFAHGLNAKIYTINANSIDHRYVVVTPKEAPSILPGSTFDLCTSPTGSIVLDPWNLGLVASAKALCTPDTITHRDLHFRSSVFQEDEYPASGVARLYCTNSHMGTVEMLIDPQHFSKTCLTLLDSIVVDLLDQASQEAHATSTNSTP